MSHLERGDTRLMPKGCSLATLGPAEPKALCGRICCLGPGCEAMNSRTWCLQWILLTRPLLNWSVCGSIGKHKGADTTSKHNSTRESHSQIHSDFCAIQVRVICYNRRLITLIMS